MSILCALGGHEAATAATYNCGYWFSECRRCRLDMIRSGGAWEVVPTGHRVVWGGGHYRHSIEPDYSRHLPVVHRDSNLPAVRPVFASWSRDLVRRKARGRSTAAAILEEAGQEPYPTLLLFVAAAAAGVQWLVTLRSG